MNEIFDIELGNKIEYYCKCFDEITVNGYNLHSDFSYSSEFELNKESHEDNNLAIFDFIKQEILKLVNIEAFVIATFVYRTVMKNLMYKNFSQWTVPFKICNILFFIGTRVEKINSNPQIVICCDECKIIKEIFNCGFSFYYNQDIFNSEGKKDSAVNEFYKRLLEISSKIGDLHSYKIKSESLQKYLDFRKLNINLLRDNSLLQIKNIFMTKEELKSNKSWENINEKFNMSNPKDDIIIISIYNYKILSVRLRNFIDTFEARSCINPNDPENELIFTYKTNRYVYISKKILDDAQRIIIDFLSWGQYGDINKYYFNQKINQENLKKYNLLMTYKISDLIFDNGYVLPLEKKDGLQIPLVEIKKYTNNSKIKNVLGDYDIVFYSKNTAILYLIEYKNYQMMISKQGDLNADISKVTRDNTVEKVIRRQEYVEENKNEFLERVFGKLFKVEIVKSIILSTKPNFYFYLKPCNKYTYLDWIEFEEKVESKAF